VDAGTVRSAGAGGDTKAAAAGSAADDEVGEEAVVAVVRGARMGVEADVDAEAEARADGSWRDGRRGERAGDPPGDADGVEVALDSSDARIPCATEDVADAAVGVDAAGTRRSESEELAPAPARAGPPWLTALWSEASSSVSESAIRLLQLAAMLVGGNDHGGGSSTERRAVQTVQKQLTAPAGGPSWFRPTKCDRFIFRRRGCGRPSHSSSAFSCLTLMWSQTRAPPAADARTVFEKILQKQDDLQGQIDGQTVHINMLMRIQSSVVPVSATLNAFTHRILLQPLGITEGTALSFFQHLESDAVARTDASLLLAASGINISLDKLLSFRREICKHRDRFEHDLVDRNEFAVLLKYLPTLNGADRALLTQLHDSELGALHALAQ
jgi:hypothetical protein